MKRRIKSGTGFCKSFRHWRSGKILRAKDYGYKAWPIGKRKR